MAENINVEEAKAILEKLSGKGSGSTSEPKVVDVQTLKTGKPGSGLN